MESRLEVQGIPSTEIDVTQIEPPRVLKASDAIVEAFGFWPGFHDAEITNIDLTRTPPTAVIGIDVTSRGIRVHAVLRFDGLASILLEGFNHQNALLGMEIAPIHDSMVRVDLHAANGVGGRIECEEVRVTEVRRSG